MVDKVGPGLLGKLVKGKRVTVINSAGGNWAEYAVIPAKQARPVASDIPDDQVASFFVNPATVLAMVRHVLKVPKGEWLLQSAAGSALGKMIIRLCKHDGIRTINVVRRREAMAELKALGGRRGDLVGRRPDRRAGPRRSTGGDGRAVRDRPGRRRHRDAGLSSRWRPTPECSSTGRFRASRSGSTRGG